MDIKERQKRVLEIEIKIEELGDELRVLKDERIKHLKVFLANDDIHVGMIYYDGSTKKKIISLELHRDDIEYILAPFNKDGVTVSKQNRNRVGWKQVVTGWRAQREDPEGYAQKLREKAKRGLKEWKEKMKTKKGRKEMLG